MRELGREIPREGNKEERHKNKQRRKQSKWQLNVNQYPNGTSKHWEPLNYPIYSLSLHFKLSFLSFSHSFLRFCSSALCVVFIIIIIPIGIIWILKLRNSPKQSAEFQFWLLYELDGDSFISIFIVDRFLFLSLSSNLIYTNQQYTTYIYMRYK